MKIILLVCTFVLISLSQEHILHEHSGTITSVDSTQIDSTEAEKQIKVIKKNVENDLNKNIEKRTPPETTNTSVQCNGRTKKGTRCKKMTKSSNGYCHLHGGN